MIFTFTVIGGLITKLIFNYEKLIDGCLITLIVIGIFFHFAILDFTLSVYFNFKSSYYAFSVIVTLSFLIFYFSKKETLRNLFFTFFLFLSIFKSINFGISHLQNIKEKNNENLTFITELKFSVNQSNGITNNNTYFVLLDGMISLDLAEKLKIINKDKILKEFKKINYLNGYTYVDNTIANYTTTHLSASSFFYLDYFVKLNTYYSKYDNFYPKIFNNEEKVKKLPFFKFLSENNIEFFMLKNRSIMCIENKVINCLDNNNLAQKFFRFIEIFFISTPLHKFLNSTIIASKDRHLDFFEKKGIPKKNNSFYFIHHLSPHGPHVNKNCKPSKYPYESLDGYKGSYKCTIKEMINFVRIIKQNDDGANIFFIADHGWTFEDNKEYKDNKKKFQTNVINLYYLNNDCKNSYPKSTINVMRLALSCINDSGIMPLEDIYFKAVEEKNFGKRKVELEDEKY